MKRETEPRLVTDPTALEQVLALALDLHKRIPGSPVPRAETLLSLPGVLRPAQAEEAVPDMTAAASGFSRALSDQNLWNMKKAPPMRQQKATAWFQWSLSPK